MVYKARKLWMGHVSVRDFLVKKCIDDKEDLIIEFDGETRRFPNRSLRTYLTNTYNTDFKSKYKEGQTYKLIDFPWGQNNDD